METNQSKGKAKKEVLEVNIEEVKKDLLSPEEIIQNEVKKYNVADGAILELKNKFKGLKIKDIDDKKGYKAVKEATSIVRNFRTGIEKKRQELKADVLVIGRGIDGEAKRLTELLLAVETPLKEKTLKIDNLIEAEKEREEAEAQKKIDDRVKELEEVGLKFDGSFYSIGENISVDIVTIKDFSDEVFSEFKYRVSVENEKVQEAEKIKMLHEERREKAIQYFSFWEEGEKNMNFGEVSESDFETFLQRIIKAEDDFKKEKQRQADEAKKQADERLAFNYEKRSFKLEKEGFEIDENGDLKFVGESGQSYILKVNLEGISNEDFDDLFEKKKTEKANIILNDESLKSKRISDAEEEAQKEADDKKKAEFREKINSRIKSFKNIGLEIKGEEMIFDEIKISLKNIETFSDNEFSEKLILSTKRKAEIEKERADEAEAERLSKLPEIEKVERYIAELMKIEIPQLNGAEFVEIVSMLKNKIKVASDEALSNLKKLN